MSHRTYLMARNEILAHLAGLPGWTVKSSLKVPQAIAPTGEIVRFKAQAVYLGLHSMWIDIRCHNGTSFAAEVLRSIESRQ